MKEKFKLESILKVLQKKKDQGWIEHSCAQTDNIGRSGIFQSGVVWNILHDAPVPSTEPGLKLTASQRVFIQTEAHACVHLSCSLSSSKGVS